MAARRHDEQEGDRGGVRDQPPHRGRGARAGGRSQRDHLHAAGDRRAVEPLRRVRAPGDDICPVMTPEIVLRSLEDSSLPYPTLPLKTRLPLRQPPGQLVALMLLGASFVCVGRPAAELPCHQHPIQFLSQDHNRLFLGFLYPDIHSVPCQSVYITRAGATRSWSRCCRGAELLYRVRVSVPNIQPMSRAQV